MHLTRTGLQDMRISEINVRNMTPCSYKIRSLISDFMGGMELSSLDFREADVEDAYNVLCAQAPISEACRQEFVPGMLYSKQEVKAKLQKIYDNLGLSGKTAKATELKLYLPVRERQKLNEEGKRVYFIETLNI